MEMPNACTANSSKTVVDYGHMWYVSAYIVCARICGMYMQMGNIQRGYPHREKY